MKLILTILLTIIITGCATDSDGFQKVRNHYNSMDLCQYYGKPEGYKIPSFCYTNANKTVYYVRDANNSVIYKVAP